MRVCVNFFLTDVHTHTHTQMIHHRVEADLSNAALELDNCQKELGIYICM